MYKHRIVEGESIEEYLVRMNAEYLRYKGILLNMEGKNPDPIDFVATLDFACDLGKWLMGDWISKTGDEEGRMSTYVKVAQLTGKSDRRSLELRRVADTFPENYRYYGIPWQLYRVCTGGEDPIGCLHEAIKLQIPPKVLYKNAHSKEKTDD